jgi:hypothetical protein
MPVLPVRGGRLVYGSGDGGRNLAEDTPAVLLKAMQVAAEAMHLAPMQVGRS